MALDFSALSTALTDLKELVGAGLSTQLGAVKGRLDTLEAAPAPSGEVTAADFAVLSGRVKAVEDALAALQAIVAAYSPAPVPEVEQQVPQ